MLVCAFVPPVYAVVFMLLCNEEKTLLQGLYDLVSNLIKSIEKVKKSIDEKLVIHNFVGLYYGSATPISSKIHPKYAIVNISLALMPA